MLPVDLDGQKVFLAGLRDSPDQPFRYLRIPADERGTMDDWMALRPRWPTRRAASRPRSRYVRKSAPAGKPELAQQLEASVLRALTLYAGVEVVRKEAPSAGLPALQDFIENAVPEEDRQRTSEVLIRILNGGLFELLNLVRERAGHPPLQPGDDTQRFMGQAVLSLSDSLRLPGAGGAEPDRFRAGPGQRLPGHPCAGQDPGLCRLRAADPGRVRDALRAGTPPVDLDRRTGRRDAHHG